MTKSSIIQLHEVKEERFYQQKHALVLKVKDFLAKKTSVSQQYKLHSEFKRRTEHSLSNMVENQFFEFWRIFFNRYENGQRGIEWFVTEQGKRLSKEEQEMSITWQSLMPKLVKLIDRNEKSSLFQDMFTNEQFPLVNVEENIPGSVAPWSGTLALLEPFDSFYYFNGVRVFEGPMNLEVAVNKVKALQEETGQTFEEIMVDYYPEVLASFIKGEAHVDKEKSEITQYVLNYKIVDQPSLFEAIQSNSEFITDKWENQLKVCNWVNTWEQYTDNALSGPIHIGNVIGTLTIEGDVLTYVTLDKDSVELFKNMFNKDMMSLQEQKTHSREVPFKIVTKNTVASLPEGSPQYMLLYANNDIRLDLDIPLPQLGHKTILDLLNEGRVEEVEAYFQQREYNLYTQVQKEHGNVEITADFNSTRKELGLPPSPFVTGGVERETTIQQIESPAKQKPVVKEEDIPVYELLGFAPATVNNFYSEDLVNFFKEKTDGKSDLTLRKYRNCLFDLREILEGYSVDCWDACNEEFWKQACLKDLPSLYDPLSKTVVKDFMSTMKALAKWLVKEGKASTLSKDVQKVTKDAEEELIEYIEGQKVK